MVGIGTWAWCVSFSLECPAASVDWVADDGLVVIVGHGDQNG